MRLSVFALCVWLTACGSSNQQVEAVVFSSGRTGDGDIYAVVPGQGPPQLILGSDQGEGALRWDPAFARVVYSRFDSRGATLFTGDSALFRDPNGDVAPVWASSGRVAYVREVDGAADVYTASPDGSSEVRRTTDELIERYPAWDPEGLRLIYAKQLESGWDLHLLDLATGDESRLTFDGVYVGHPAWSPSGREVTYDRMFGDQTEIVVMSLADGQTVRVTTNDENDLLPSWSTDGSQLVFAGERDGNWDVWLYSIADTEIQRLTTSPAFDGGPIFVPAGHLF